jgi:hypothetical protein
MVQVFTCEYAINGKQTPHNLSFSALTLSLIHTLPYLLRFLLQYVSRLHVIQKMEIRRVEEHTNFYYKALPNDIIQKICMNLLDKMINDLRKYLVKAKTLNY